MSGIQELASELRSMGYPNLTAKSDSVSGIIYGIDMSEGEFSVPQGENTGPFKTLDNPNELIPDDIKEICNDFGYNVKVLGHGAEDLHIYIN